MPNTPSPDEYDEIYDAEDYEHLTPLDALFVAGMLLDNEMPVPVDLIVKAHSGGFYIAH